MAKSMSGTSKRSKPMNSETSRNATSSPASGDGALPSDSPAGRMTDLFGQVVAPVSPSAPQAPILGATIRATFGLRGSSSLQSAALGSSLVSRLRQRLTTDGSILFSMTWNEKATPRGRLVYQLAASGRSTSDNGSGSWQSPMAGTNRKSERAMSREGNSRKGGGQRSGPGLEQQAEMAIGPWPTPMAGTPGTEDYNAAGSTDYERKVDTLMGTRDTPNGPKVPGPTSSGSLAVTAKRGQLNPAFALWLMGYPTAWARCAARVMRSSRKSRPK